MTQEIEAIRERPVAAGATTLGRDEDDASGVLDPPWNELRTQAHRAVDALVDAMAEPRALARWRAVPAEARRRIRAPFDARGIGLSASMDAVLRDVLPYPSGNADPRFWGWVFGSGVPAAILGDLVAAGMNSNNFSIEQSAAHVELAVVDWLKDLVGYPAASAGLMVGGGSIANLTGLAVARDARAHAGRRTDPAHRADARYRLYASDQTHSSIDKALHLLGLGKSSLRTIPVDAEFRIDLDALERALADDRRAGLLPFAVVGNAGTVNTGAIDPLDDLADIAAREGAWLHVDAAIGAAAMLTDAGRTLLHGIGRSHSIAVDLHKWLYMPYECSAVLVREGERQRETFGGRADYLANAMGGTAGGPFPFNEFGLQLSRGDKALKAWLALRAHGTEPFAATIAGNLRQAAYLAARVRDEPRLELMAPVPLCVVCFRYRAGETLDAAAEDALNRGILVALQERGIAVPSSTVVGGRFVLRVCITNHRTRTHDLDALVEAVLRLGRELLDDAPALFGARTHQSVGR